MECTSALIPQRMHRRVTVLVLSVCLSDTKLTATYLVSESKLHYYKIPHMIRVDFDENTLFASFGVVC
jgi:hypothetical protein